MALRIIRGLLLYAGTALLVSCAYQPVAYAPGDPCLAASFTVTDDFSGARRGECTVVGDNHVELLIRPEDEGKVNNSPWYAFRLDAASPVTARITLRYEGGTHRYWPKLSSDRETWTRFDDAAVTTAEDATNVELDVSLSKGTVWVAAQSACAMTSPP